MERLLGRGHIPPPGEKLADRAAKSIESQMRASVDVTIAVIVLENQVDRHDREESLSWSLRNGSSSSFSYIFGILK